MRFAFVSQSAEPAFSLFRKDLITSLVSSGHEVYCLANNYDDGSRERVSRLGAVPIDYPLSRSGLNPVKDFSSVMALFLIFRRIRPHVVFCFFVKPSMYGAAAAWLARVPRVISLLEGLGYMYTDQPSGMSVKKRILQGVHGLMATLFYVFTDHLYFLNADDARELQAKSLISRKKIRVVGPIGLDFKDYPYQPIRLDGPVNFIFVGRLLREKGIREFVAAADRVKSVHVQANFHVIGSIDPGNPSSLSADEVDDIARRGAVRFIGKVDNVSEWLSRSHVFVLPSYREGFPRSTQEAMAMGRVVITTDVPGCRDSVCDGVSGFVVPPFDVDALAEKIAYFVVNQAMIQTMGDQAHQFAMDNFDVHKVNQKLIDDMIG